MNVVNRDIAEDLRSFKVIDGHAHLGYYKLFNMPDNDIKGILKRLKQTGMLKAAVSPMMGLEADYKLGNDYTAKAISKSKGSILGYACINPWEDDVKEELKRCFDELGMSLIKLHPDLIDCPADSERYIPVYEFADERNLTVMNHSWGSGENLRTIARKYKNMKLIQAHYATAWDGTKMPDIVKAVKEMDNAWLDTAGSGNYYGAFEKMVNYLGADKLIFGTDFPFLDAAWQIGNIFYSDITETEKKKIMYDNFNKLIND